MYIRVTFGLVFLRQGVIWWINDCYSLRMCRYVFHVLATSPNIFAVRSNFLGMYTEDLTLLHLLSPCLSTFSTNFAFGLVNIDL